MLSPRAVLVVVAPAWLLLTAIVQASEVGRCGTAATKAPFEYSAVPAPPSQTTANAADLSSSDNWQVHDQVWGCAECVNYPAAAFAWHDAYSLDGAPDLACTALDLGATGAASTAHSSTSDASENGGPAAAFDGDTQTAWVGSLGDGGGGDGDGGGASLTFAFDVAQTVHGYELVGGPDVLRAADPLTWAVHGSNDGGATWQTLGVQYAADLQWWQGRRLRWGVDDISAAFQLFRIQFTRTTGGAAHVALGDVALLTCDTTFGAASDLVGTALRTSLSKRQPALVQSLAGAVGDLRSAEHGVVIPHIVTVSLAQSRHNSLNNDFTPAGMPVVSARLVLFEGLVVDEAVAAGGLLQLAEVPGVRLNPDPAAAAPEEPVRALQVPAAEAFNDAGWHEVSFTFALVEPCADCRVAVEFVLDGGWISYTGSQFFASSPAYSAPALPVAAPQYFFYDASLVMPRRAARADISPPTKALPARTNCPHDADGLLLWHDPATWGDAGAVPAAGAHVVLPEGVRVLVQACSLESACYELIEVPATSELIFDDQDLALCTGGIIVRGALRLGSPTCRLRARVDITLTGDRETVLAAAGGRLDVAGKGIVALGGTVDMHGAHFASWALLASPVSPGARRVALQQPVNWEAGQKIVVVTSVWEDEWRPQNEVLTVAGVGHEVHDGRDVWVVETVEEAVFSHYAGPDYQVEVALRSRNIRVVGDAQSEEQQFGGHILITGAGGAGRFAGVHAERMGQLNVLARYPFHLHMLGDAGADSSFSDCSVTRSYFRCFTIHGSNGALVSDTVSVDVLGNCYYLEDGVEERNRFEYNLAAQVRVIGEPALGGGQGGDVLRETAARIQPADSTAAGFYITNAQNWFVGNHASGGWTGFSFPNLPSPIGMHRGVSLADGRSPSSRNLLEFDGNVAHSSGYFWNRGSCIYVGGRLQHLPESEGFDLQYVSGRIARSTLDDEGNATFMYFSNMKLFLCRRGINHWGRDAEVERFEAHDVLRSGVIFGGGSIKNALIVGHSLNPDRMTDPREGFQYYDTFTKNVITNVTFRNYGPNDNIFSALEFSDTFKPQWIAAATNIRYENVDRAIILNHPRDRAETGSSWMFNIVDADGSLTLRGRPTIVGSDTPWWRVGEDCELDADWLTWLCDRDTPGRGGVSSLHLEIPGLEATADEINEIISHTQIGIMNNQDTADVLAGGSAALEQGSDISAALTLTKNSGIVTGVGNRIWHAHFHAGTPRQLSVTTAQVAGGDFVVLAVNVPLRSSVGVTLRDRWAWPDPFTFPAPQAASMAEVLEPTEPLRPRDEIACPELDSLPANHPDQRYRLCSDTGGSGPLWFHDDSDNGHGFGTLYVRVVDVRRYSARFLGSGDEDFISYEMDGIVFPQISNFFEFHISVGCPAEAEACADSPVCVLPTTRPCLPRGDYERVPQPQLAYCGSAASVAEGICTPLTPVTLEEPMAGLKVVATGGAGDRRRFNYAKSKRVAMHSGISLLECNQFALADNRVKAVLWRYSAGATPVCYLLKAVSLKSDQGMLAYSYARQLSSFVTLPATDSFEIAHTGGAMYGGDGGRWSYTKANVRGRTVCLDAQECMGACYEDSVCAGFVWRPSRSACYTLHTLVAATTGTVMAVSYRRFPWDMRGLAEAMLWNGFSLFASGGNAVGGDGRRLNLGAVRRRYRSSKMRMSFPHCRRAAVEDPLAAGFTWLPVLARCYIVSEALEKASGGAVSTSYLKNPAGHEGSPLPHVDSNAFTLRHSGAGDADQSPGNKRRFSWAASRVMRRVQESTLARCAQECAVFVDNTNDDPCVAFVYKLVNAECILLRSRRTVRTTSYVLSYQRADL